MAGWKAHFGGGIILCLLFTGILFFLQLSNHVGGLGGWRSLVVILPTIFLYSLLPDGDHENSKITWIMIPIGAGINFVCSVYVWLTDGNPVLTVYSALLMFVMVGMVKLPHRGITHTLTSAIFFSVPLIFVTHWIVAIMGFVAYWSHLWLDLGKGKPFYPTRLWGAWK